MHNKQILIVEDEAPMRAALKDKLKDAGYRVLEARDGIERLAVAKKEHPDLILLDLLMPNMNGQDMLVELRKKDWGKTVPVIVLTNSNENDTILETLQKDAQDYFIKSEISLQELIDDIKLRIGSPDS